MLDPLVLNMDNPYYNYYNHFQASFKARVEIDYEMEITPVCVTSLSDLCCKKLVMDVHYLSGSVHRLPHCLYFLILYKALDLSRTLTIKNFLKNCPEKVFILPTPNLLSNWTVLEMQHLELQEKMKTFIQNTVTVLSSFLDIMCKNQISCLEILDMNEAFIPVPILRFCLRVLTNLQNLPKKTYLLKTGVIVMKKEDMKYLIDLKTFTPFSSFFKIFLIGISIVELHEEVKLLSLLKLLENDELMHFSFELYQTVHPIIPELRRFHLLQSLTLTYVTELETNKKLLLAFGDTLYAFRFLKNLILNGSCLRNCLYTLLTHKCICTQNPISQNKNCCILHRGCIEYLNLEACRLIDPDIVCLQGFSSSSTLKVLNIGCNRFNAQLLAETIGKLGNSLIILNLKYINLPFSAFQYIFQKLKFLPSLKSLNLSETHLATEDFLFLSKCIENLPNLRRIYFSLPSDVNEVLIRENILKQIKIIWC